MSIELLEAPSVEPVTLDEAKLHLRADTSEAEDALLELLIEAARGWVEEQCARALLSQRWRLTLPTFPSGSAGSAIALSRPPILSVESVKYVDEAGDLITLDVADYELQAVGLPPVVRPAIGTSWPATKNLGSRGAAVIVEYTAGYGTESAAVPGALRAALLLALGDLYANRESQFVGTITTPNPTAKALLGPYRVLEAV